MIGSQGAVLTSSKYNAAHHHFSVFVAALAFLLIVAGGLVTSNNAGLAVPDWPTSFGHLFKIPKMIGGVKFEHGHRMIAEFVGLLTIIVAVWTWRVDSRRWMRGLTLGAVAGVVFQGVLGGLTVLNFLPPAISTAHAAVGQTMFCVLAAIAVFTSRSWLEEPVEKVSRKDARPLLRHCWMLIGFLNVQLILGAAFRHVWTKWGPSGSNHWPIHKIVHVLLYPHMLNALFVSALVLYVSLRVLTKHSNIPHLRKPALWLLLTLIAQLLLGISAYVVRVVQGVNEAQPTMSLVVVTVAHLAVGALMLVLSAVLTIQSYRHTGEPAAVIPFKRGREVATA
ncbi:MAG TPA: COX15/CtaA family protein [Candidatus Sulfotelmatobacter sp.]|nr:COX15/CtaA family protein [Candidatus Sulfotelmatobacter sp.]